MTCAQGLLCRLRNEPAQGKGSVVEGSGEAVMGSEAVRDRDPDGVGELAHGEAEGMEEVGTGLPNTIGTAMSVQNHRPGSCQALGSENTHPYVLADGHICCGDPVLKFFARLHLPYLAQPLLHLSSLLLMDEFQVPI